MNDPEFWVRKQVVRLMPTACECEEHAAVKLKIGGRGQVDVLCRPRVLNLAAFTFAVEVKSHSQVGDRQLGPWLKQAFDYVAAAPDNGWAPVAASFVWLVGMELHLDEDEQLRMNGMLQLAQHFRVGKAHQTNAGLTLVFGPSAEVFREKRGGWTTNAAELFGAKRVSGGLKKPMI
jgi:hypothetical protein